MSAAIKKPPPPNTVGHRPSINPSISPSHSSRGPSPSIPSTSTSMNRTRSVKGSNNTLTSARAVAKRPGAGASNLSNSNLSLASDNASEDDARAETVALIDELKSRLQKAETASEEYQRQLSVLQTRLDDAHNEQGKLEEQVHECHHRTVALEDENRESARRMRDMEGIYGSERVAMFKEKEEQDLKEEEMQSVIQRLKETLAQKDMRMSIEGDGRLSRSSSLRSRSSPDIENGHFAPPSSLQRSTSRNNSKLLMQKDKIIESLRLELAEAQIKIVEVENMGGGRMQGLEKILLETRMTNTRLMEDNESFQLLLSEKTLNGDFSKADFMPGSNNAQSSGTGSLADELESATEGESESYRRLESEIKSLKDQNKALTLYIESIISRLLQHKDFESLLDKTPDLMAGPKPLADTEKDLPPPPSKEGETTPSILQRARSVVAGPTRPKPRPRPFSQMPPPVAAASTTPNEDPSKAPSIPLGRSQSVRGGGHRRANSDLANASSVVNHMYRGPSFGNSTSGMMSPGISPAVSTPRTSFFSPTLSSSNPNAAARIPSGSLAPGERISSGSNSILSDHSGEVGTPSPPRSTAGSANFTGAVTTQNKLRPLRLVQENKEMESGDQGGGARPSEDEDAAKKKANRGSWMGWFNRGKEEEAPRTVRADELKEQHENAANGR
ncbi:MAG: hypothetical protein M1830_007376 [Pleopsidium flavum]|nr:MAG: hypothetical protein M1830_007376 [Pleopsidium flavum]